MISQLYTIWLKVNRIMIIFLRRNLKLSVTALRHRPHMVPCSQGIFWDKDSVSGTSIGCVPLCIRDALPFGKNLRRSLGYSHWSSATLDIFCQADFPIFVDGIPHRHREKFPTFSGPCQETDSTTVFCRIRLCSNPVAPTAGHQEMAVVGQTVNRAGCHLFIGKDAAHFENSSFVVRMRPLYS